MQFTYPWALSLLLPWAVAAWFVLRQKKSGGVIFASASTRFTHGLLTWRYWLARVLPFGYLVALLLLIIAAAGPRTSLAREVRNADALAVVMSVDVSGSMQALDLSTDGKEVTRLDVVKDTFRTFVEARGDDLIGLVTFGGYASVRSPLTADHQALLHTLSGVHLPVNGVDDKGRPITDEEFLTAIGDGLALALARLQKAEPKTKIVILLSDGESNAGVATPREASEAAKKLGIRVYTIGVGSTGVANVRVTDNFGRSQLMQTRVNLDETTLKEIAETTGGVYYNVRSPDALKNALETIGQLETTRVERQIYYRYKEHFAGLLIAGAVLLALSLISTMSILRRPI